MSLLPRVSPEHPTTPGWLLSLPGMASGMLGGGDMGGGAVGHSGGTPRIQHSPCCGVAASPRRCPVAVLARGWCWGEASLAEGGSMPFPPRAVGVPSATGAPPSPPLLTFYGRAAAASPLGPLLPRDAHSTTGLSSAWMWPCHVGRGTGPPPPPPPPPGITGASPLATSCPGVAGCQFRVSFHRFWGCSGVMAGEGEAEANPGRRGLYPGEK